MQNQIGIFVILIAIGVLAFATLSFNDSGEDAYIRLDNTASNKEEYTFNRYIFDGNKFEGVLAPLNVSSIPNATDATLSSLESGLRVNGVNFAGHYSIVTLGCGLGCQTSTIIDAIDGKALATGIISAYGLAYSPDSTLLIINPDENIPQDADKTSDISTDFYSIIEGGLNSELIYLAKKFVGGKDGVICSQVATAARNPLTDETKEFSTSCDIPFGWEQVTTIE